LEVDILNVGSVEVDILNVGNVEVDKRGGDGQVFQIVVKIDGYIPLNFQAAVETETEEESIFRKSSSNDDLDDTSDDDSSMRSGAGPYEWISNLVPFGHPNRHLLSVAPVSRRFRRFVGDKKKSVQSGAGDASFRLLNVSETLFYATLNHTNPQLVTICMKLHFGRKSFRANFQPTYIHRIMGKVASNKIQTKKLSCLIWTKLLDLCKGAKCNKIQQSCFL
jgi:hypothetical protein